MSKEKRYIAKERRASWIVWDTEENKPKSNFKYHNEKAAKDMADALNEETKEKDKDE